MEMSPMRTRSELAVLSERVIYRFLALDDRQLRHDTERAFAAAEPLIQGRVDADELPPQALAWTRAPSELDQWEKLDEDHRTATALQVSTQLSVVSALVAGVLEPDELDLLL